MSTGMTAMLLGILAGFLVLVGLYLWLVGGDPTMGAVMFALAGSQLALIPVAARGKRRGADCAKD